MWLLNRAFTVCRHCEGRARASHGSSSTSWKRRLWRPFRQSRRPCLAKPIPRPSCLTDCGHRAARDLGPNVPVRQLRKHDRWASVNQAHQVARADRLRRSHRVAPRQAPQILLKLSAQDATHDCRAKHCSQVDRTPAACPISSLRGTLMILPRIHGPF